MKSVLVLNGPNLSRLGSREPEIYGDLNLEDLEAQLQLLASELSVAIIMQQSDSESVLIKAIHEATDSETDVVLYPASFTHYS
jgi:3-dehydroquinate dehydratase-2